jgi:hypothetical protein
MGLSGSYARLSSYPEKGGSTEVKDYGNRGTPADLVLDDWIPGAATE